MSSSTPANKKLKPVDGNDAKLIIGYWNIRGLLSPIIYLLEYLGVEYELEKYVQADDFSVKTWLDVKETLGLELPNLPYMIHGDFKLSETQAILRYICNEYAPEMLGKTVRDKAAADMVLSWAKDGQSIVTTHCYGSGDRHEAEKNILHRAPRLEAYLANKHFVAGDSVTFVDFVIFEHTELFNWVTEGKYLKLNPSIAAHHGRVAALPSFAAFHKSPRFMQRPFNNKSAKLNN